MSTITIFSFSNLPIGDKLSSAVYQQKISISQPGIPTTNLSIAYNFIVPTSFYHISIALEIINHPGLNSDIRSALNECSSDFLFGNTAPDVQSISNQSRQATHFFSIPANDEIPAWQHMLSDYPNLGDFSKLSLNQVVFLIGYICHLEADQKWITDIFLPGFGPDADWKDFQERLYWHNVMRVYLDNQVLSALPEGIGNSINACQPKDWLPFTTQSNLQKWKTYLADQLQPGATIKTAEVFAERHNLPASEFSEIMTSEQAMDENVFTYLSRDNLATYRQELVAENVQLINQHMEINRG